MKTTTIETAKIECDAAKQHLQEAHVAYRQAQENLQNLHTRRGQLQAKVEHYEAAAQAADQDFKALFSEHDFTNSAPVKSALAKKIANQEMAQETAVALAECVRAIEEFPFRQEVVSQTRTYEAAHRAAYQAHADLLLANALAEVPQSLLYAIAMRLHLANIDTRDFKGTPLLLDDQKEAIARATSPIFEAIGALAHACDVQAELQAAGIAVRSDDLPGIPRKTPAQVILHKQRQIAGSHILR
ncbi:Uncharacterised protein [uncultured Comamonas sp.]|nr:Uncharacterised protein [uncultured Comamonas sp.]